MSDQENSQQEPTMEEILASIRRIISEDGDPEEEAVEATEPEEEFEPVPEPEPEPEPKPEPEPEPQSEEDVLDLTDVAEEEPVGDDDLMMVEAEEEPEPAPAPVAAAPAPADDDNLLGEAAAGAAMAAFGNLAKSATLGSANTIEEVVIAALRPLLKAWLDENLPGIVEELVQREVERVSGGGVS